MVARLFCNNYQMRYIFLLLFILLFTLPVKSNAYDYTSMAVVLHTKSGETTTFDLAGNVTAHIDNEDVVIKSSAAEVRYPIVDGVSFTLSNIEDNSVRNVVNSRARFSIRDGKLICEGLQHGEHVRLYNLEGFQLNSVIADDNGRASLPFTVDGSQVIIVKTNNKNFKIIKR